MRIKTIILLTILLMPIVFAAEWKEVELKHTWDKKSFGFCKTAEQCLVNNAYSEDLDNQPDKYWSGMTNAERPKCINDKQFIADNYCEQGEWTSRTKLVAEQLIQIAGTDYSIYCDKYDKTLNHYAYNTNYGPVTTFLGKYCTLSKRTENCANNICAIKYGRNIAFGMAINTDISGEKSPLKAFNMSEDECDEEKKQGGYFACGKNHVWYNHDTQSIIYAPGLTSMPIITETTKNTITEPFEKISTYVFDNVHNPQVQQYNYSFYDTPHFNNLYIAKTGNKLYYGFKQENISDKLIPTDYAGWYIENMELPLNACEKYIKTYDGKASCEEQPSETEFYIVGYKKPPANPKYKTPSIIDAWPDLTGKMRIT